MIFMRFEDFQKAYSGKRVFVTGHTGFKGSWLALMLHLLGAEVYAYALEPPTDPSLFNILGLSGMLRSETGDVRDYGHLLSFFREASPDYVFHLAAQPIVRTSYRYPRETYETNVMGTVNILECLRQMDSGCSFLNVTTDKVYENPDDPDHAFSEGERLDGFDPYSNSKSCSELVTHCYQRSFFHLSGQEDRAENTDASERSERLFPLISTARAGNVIGGGDFAKDRIIPDCVRSASMHEPIPVRNPHSTRPYQHVLEPLAAYLMIAARQKEDPRLQGSYNVGPEEEDALSTGDLADLFVKCWGGDASWDNLSEKGAPHEASFLRLDTGRLKRCFSWKPLWHAEKAVRETVLWYQAYFRGEDMLEMSRRQIHDYLCGDDSNRDWV